MSFADAIRDALDDSLAQWPEMLLIGEGVPDPKAIFGTTQGLQQKYGADRVLDMPLSENGMTGVCIGAALDGMRPVMIHQRIEFVMLAMDQLVNNAAKWHYMFNGQQQVPIVIRMIIGRGWGQGPQHSQGLQALFAKIPGLKVVMPATSHDAYHMMKAAIEDNNPVLFIEHRWLHHITGPVDKGNKTTDLAGAKVLQAGEDVTIAAYSQMVIESLRAAEELKQYGINAEVIDMRCLTPVDIDTVFASVKKTGRLIVVDCACDTATIAHTIISKIIQRDTHVFTCPPQVIAWPDHPVPTSHFQAENYYPGYKDIIDQALMLLARGDEIGAVENITGDVIPKDIPDRSFVGPF
ncbi:MAG: alpha-ketoacid dehydrogenase subunit beta [Gammaproteobacteria bacterium]|nr:alpha-ketoacid dehydrogenase subunit beta [Gammaproteobacteria bacterium]